MGDKDMDSAKDILDQEYQVGDIVAFPGSSNMLRLGVVTMIHPKMVSVKMRTDLHGYQPRNKVPAVRRNHKDVIKIQMDAEGIREYLTMQSMTAT